jgi:hypothetical protein
VRGDVDISWLKTFQTVDTCKQLVDTFAFKRREHLYGKSLGAFALY